MDELVFCLPEKKWVSIYVHCVACGHLGLWYLPSWSVPGQLECPWTAGVSLDSWSVLVQLSHTHLRHRTATVY
jgi:hypothetical protein